MGNNMKNLFDYATSELSQDAFLCWLFENYDCENENVRNTAIALLKKMTGLSDLTSESVQDLKTERQVSYTHKEDNKKYRCVFDIVVTFKHYDAECALLIEDKVFSSASKKQKEVYLVAFKERFKEYKRFFYVFYKTDLISDGARETLKTAGWSVFSLIEINDFFTDLPSPNCLILNQYIEHIHSTYENATVVPTDPMAEWKDDRLRVRTFINQKLIPHSQSQYQNDPNADLVGVFPSGYYHYESLIVEDYRLCESKKVVFKLEIIFRPYRDRAEVKVSIWRRQPQEPHGTQLDKTVDKDIIIRNTFRDLLLKKGNLFRKYDSLWCVASASSSFKKNLEYANPIDELEAACQEVINAFAAACEEMKGADCYEE